MNDSAERLTELSVRAPEQQDKRAEWIRLETLLERLAHTSLRTLSAGELREFARLYRRATSDLSLARARGRHDLAAYLNSLVARAHVYIYAQPARPFLPLRGFFTEIVPQTFRRCLLFWGVSLLLMGSGIVIGWGTASHDPAWAELWLGAELRATLENFLRTADQAGRYFAETAQQLGGSGLAMFLMTNNIQVALLAFALGMTAGAGTAFVLARNALMIGAALGLGTFHQQGALMAAVVAPHGIVEISAVIVAGAAGLRLGWALIRPGDLLRRDALRLAGREAGWLALGVIPLFIFAGLVEAFVSPVTRGPLASEAFRLWFGVATGLLAHLWLFSGLLRPKRRQE